LRLIQQNEKGQKLKTISKIGGARLALSVSLLGALAACGGGGSGSGSGSSSTASSASANAQTLSGTVAVGDALVGATITVQDSAGHSVTATSGTNGAYSASLANLTPPLLITATDPSGTNAALYSILASTASTTSGITANVTPLTTAVTAALTSDGNPADFTSTATLGAVTSAQVSTAVSQINTALAPILAQNGLAAASFDPIGGAFTPNQTGADAVIDAVQVTPSSSGAGLQLSSLADPNTVIPLSRSASNTTKLQPPAQPANYLASLLASLSQCMAGTSSSCVTAIDSNYLNDGFATMQARHSGLFGQGNTLLGARTIAFLPAGTFSAISNPGALVYFLYLTPSGTMNFASEFVQQLPNKTWDIIGNQEQFNLYIASFVDRKQFTDAADAGNARYDSGIQIQIPQAVTVGGTLTPVGSALVQGPGISGGSLYMLNTAVGFGNPTYDLTIPTPALTSPWTGCGTCAQSNSTTSTYKWDWVSLQGGTSAFSPNGAADYAPAPIDVAALPQHPIYTITLFGATGSQIGQPQQVMNIAGNVRAAAGLMVPWQTLGTDVIGNFLTPGGSQATAAQTSVNLDWTAPTFLGKTAPVPNFVVGMGAVTLATATSPEEAYSHGFGISATAAASSSFSAPFSVTGGSVVTEGLGAEALRYVKLGWQSGDGIYFANEWVYKQ
jgi:hypothetical protein